MPSPHHPSAPLRFVRLSPLRLTLLFMALPLAGCGGCMVENLDVAATLAATPPAALATAVAEGARFDLSIDDACSTGGLLGCSPERVTRITGVEVNGAIATVAWEEDGSNKLTVEAFDDGTTDIAVTAQFEGEDAGERTASITLDVREVAAVDLELWCDRDADAVAVPPGVGLTTTLAYLGTASPGGEGELISVWHHDVDWPEEIAFDGETPEDFAFTDATSPATTSLTFTTLGWHTAVDARSGEALLDLFVYAPEDLTDLELDASATLLVEEQSIIDVSAFVDDLALCVDSPEVVVEAFVFDPDVCGLGGLNVDNWQGSLTEPIPINGGAPGLCEVEVILPDADLSAVIAIDVTDL
jgi:hypothetical protein